ncbi:hypothetical protein MIND_00674200 [Mycena indigotica]|uniref:Uncharacterized protein n=1 Tax=Mycena indigotica TaxID=2126181 RepID=A0A8H6SLN3_9AGAR|nr:uncharacterized protein MIND_00674200 [Mycena indigotica]KAF7301102.1 hypothetical protein MIND_00674200 [Mycena indigotica]
MSFASSITTFFKAMFITVVGWLFTRNCEANGDAAYSPRALEEGLFSAVDTNVVATHFPNMYSASTPEADHIHVVKPVPTIIVTPPSIDNIYKVHTEQSTTSVGATKDDVLPTESVVEASAGTQVMHDGNSVVDVSANKEPHMNTKVVVSVNSQPLIPSVSLTYLNPRPAPSPPIKVMATPSRVPLCNITNTRKPVRVGNGSSKKKQARAAVVSTTSRNVKGEYDQVVNAGTLSLDEQWAAAKALVSSRRQQIVSYKRLSAPINKTPTINVVPKRYSAPAIPTASTAAPKLELEQLLDELLLEAQETLAMVESQRIVLNTNIQGLPPTAPLKLSPKAKFNTPSPNHALCLNKSAVASFHNDVIPPSSALPHSSTLATLSSCGSIGSILDHFEDLIVSPSWRRISGHSDALEKRWVVEALV